MRKETFSKSFYSLNQYQVLHPKNDPTNHFLSSTYLIPIWDWYIYHPKPLGAPSEPQNSHTYTPKNTIFPSMFAFMADIRCSTPKMTPLTIFGFNLSHTYLVLSYLPFLTSEGPIRDPKLPHIHPKKHNLP